MIDPSMPPPFLGFQYWTETGNVSGGYGNGPRRSGLSTVAAQLKKAMRVPRFLHEQIIRHARESSPNECCGLIGGTPDGEAGSIYPTRNLAANPLVTYEAAPEDLFAAQRQMRERGEQLIAIYHSHPRAADPEPSATDVRLAYYPAAVYLIVGLGNSEPCVRAFRINEREGWETIHYEIVD